MDLRPRFRPMNTAGLSTIGIGAVVVTALVAGSSLGLILTLVLGVPAAVLFAVYVSRSAHHYQAVRATGLVRPAEVAGSTGDVLSPRQQAQLLVRLHWEQTMVGTDTLVAGFVAGAGWFAAANISRSFSAPAVVAGLVFAGLAIRLLVHWQQYRRAWSAYARNLSLPWWARSDPRKHLGRDGFHLDAPPGLMSTPVMAARTLAISAVFLGTLLAYFVTHIR